MINKKVVLNRIIKAIKEEQVYIKKANEIDKKHYKMQIDINRLAEITEMLKKEDISEENINQDIIISHNGNPYVTYILAIKGICNDINLDICVNETMLGTNAIIVKIINEVLKDLKIKTKIQVDRKLEIERLKDNPNTKVIILQDKAEYSKLLKLNVENVYYRPKYNISIYADEEYKELEQDILKYCFENFIEIEIYEANDLEDAIEQLEADNQGETIMILTKEDINLEKIEKLRNEYNIEININKNMLKNLEEKLIKEKYYKVGVDD